MTATEAMHDTADAVVIGGGFYGCAIAIFLVKQIGLKRVTLVEREGALMTHASYNNQARVHNGYHYPRSFVTAHRSRVNLPRFMDNWPEAVKTDFTKLYAIARRNSKVTARQFQRFCKEIGASLDAAELKHRQLFDSRLIEEVFLVKEYAFDATVLAQWARKELDACGVDVRMNTQVDTLHGAPAGGVLVHIKGPNGHAASIHCRKVFNCTYSGLNQIGGAFEGTHTKLKHEITEMALMQMPPVLADVGITVMDGPFFSMMPFPARGLHTLSHVRYTPHMHWMDQPGVDPYQRLATYDKVTRVDRMVRDVSRYVPAVLDAQYKDSLFEVKTILTKNEVDDGRPILFEKHKVPAGCISILGGKIDNIFDALERIQSDLT